MTESTAVAVLSTPSLDDYLVALKKPRALQNQQALSAAYDEACHALIGPNDIQQDKGRSFKKKSAWRKLARYFNISVASDLGSVRVDHSDDGFTAYAVATASAPWGQSWSDVGACGSDEASGRRTITIADAVATAMTRASNRAVSNLIAMGEVSAEEIGQRELRGGGRSGQKADEDKIMPFGDTKGTRLGDVTTDDLTKTRAWCVTKDATKFKDLIAAITSVLENRHAASNADGDGVLIDENGDELPW